MVISPSPPGSSFHVHHVSASARFSSSIACAIKITGDGNEANKSPSRVCSKETKQENKSPTTRVE